MKNNKKLEIVINFETMNVSNASNTKKFEIVILM
jgi:hypothetical protein